MTLTLRALLVVCLGLTPMISVVAQPMPITSDTPEYCIALADRLAAMRGVPEAIAAKVAEARHMCAQGRLHAGIVTLRHCAMMLRPSGS